MSPSQPYGGNAQHGAVFIPDVHNQTLSMSGNLGKKSHQEGKTGLLKEENLSGRESSPAWSRASPERAGEQMSVGFILDLAAARGRGTAGNFGQFSKAKIENPCLSGRCFQGRWQSNPPLGVPPPCSSIGFFCRPSTTTDHHQPNLQAPATPTFLPTT